MSESLFPPFLKWGNYNSKDENNPDILKVEPLELETSETEYSINVIVKVDGEEKTIPLHNFESKNRRLFQLWIKAKKEGRIKTGKKFKIKTWLGISKNNFPIRRYELIF